MTKDSKVESLGEQELLLPDRVNRGLIAGDRVQYYITLLQAAKRHALEPASPASDLRAERKAVGLHDAVFDTVVARSSIKAGGDVSVPATPAILHGLFSELAVMLRSLRAAADVVPDLEPALASYALRLARLHADAPSGSGGKLPAPAIDALTSGGDVDSVYQLSVDLRAELNHVLALIANDAESGRGLAERTAGIEMTLQLHVPSGEAGDEGLCAAVEEHGRYVSVLAERLRRAFVDEPGATGFARAAEVAHTLTARADEIARRWNRRCFRAGDRRGLDVVRAADAAAGALDHSAVLLTLVPAAHAGDAFQALAELLELVERGAQDYGRALAFAARIERHRDASDVEALQVAVDSLGAVARRCSGAARAAEARRFTDAPAGERRFVSPIAQALATAAEAMAACAVLVKDMLADATDRS